MMPKKVPDEEPAPTIDLSPPGQVRHALPAQRFKVKLRNPGANPYQHQLCRSPLKRKIVRAGRRGGKTTGAAILAVEAFMAKKRVLYATPTLDQIQKFWKEVKRALDEPLAYGQLYKNETEHIIERRGTEQRIRAKTAWNADTLRGDYADLLILDEFQMMDETAWTEVGAPMLIDTNGDCVFIYTPPSLETRSASKARDPRYASKLFKLHQNDPLWLCLHFPSSANPFLSREGLDEVSRNMTKLAYRQEIMAEDTDEVPGAIWTRKLIEETRVQHIPCDLQRAVVGIDPPGGRTTECGIVGAGMGTDGHLYFHRDKSTRAPSPKVWAIASIELYKEISADVILGERNYGGDMVEETIRNIDENISYKDVNATRGKVVRAQPVCAMFEQGKAHIVGDLPELEDEMCSFVPGEPSPNRMDAMVWCGIDLIGSGTLGLVEFFKSGAAEKVMTEKIEKPAMVKVMTNDQTPKCPQCSGLLLAQIAGQIRCQACGHQWWPGGANPHQQKPLGGRRILLEKMDK